MLNGDRGAVAPRIAVFAFSRRGYLYGAANLALSIKSHGPAHVHLFVDQALLKYLPDFHRTLFDVVEVIPDEIFTTNGQSDPGKCKSRLYDALDDGDWLYIDADTLCLAPIQGFWNHLVKDERPFVCEVIDGYTPWASPEKIRAKVGSDGASVYGVQTSWMFIHKGDGFGGTNHRFACEKHICQIVDDMHQYRTWQRSELDHQWGKSMPDELLYSTACAKLGYNPTGPRVTFYGKEAGHTLEDVRSKYLFLSLYGNGRGRTLVRKEYVQWYDPILADAYKRAGEVHMFKANFIQQDKYLG